MLKSLFLFRFNKRSCRLFNQVLSISASSLESFILLGHWLFIGYINTTLGFLIGFSCCYGLTFTRYTISIFCLHTILNQYLLVIFISSRWESSVFCKCEIRLLLFLKQGQCFFFSHVILSFLAIIHNFSKFLLWRYNNMYWRFLRPALWLIIDYLILNIKKFLKFIFVDFKFDIILDIFLSQYNWIRLTMLQLTSSTTATSIFNQNIFIILLLWAKVIIFVFLLTTFTWCLRFIFNLSSQRL